MRARVDLLCSSTVGSSVGAKVGDLILAGLPLLKRSGRDGREEEGGNGSERLHFVVFEWFVSRLFWLSGIECV